MEIQPEINSSREQIQQMFVEYTTRNTELQKKNIDAIHSYSSEEESLGWKEGSWKDIENAFKSDESYLDVDTGLLAMKIKNNYPGKYEMRSLVCSEILDNEGKPQRVFVRRHEIKTDGEPTIITEIMDVPNDIKKAKETKFYARLASNNGVVVNLQDLVNDSSKDKTHLKYTSKLPPMPVLVSGILCVLNPSLKEGSSVDLMGDGKLTVDESINSRMSGFDNEVSFLHEAGHSNQSLMKEFIGNLRKKASQKVNGEFMPKVSRYVEIDAFVFAILASNKCEELGVPILPQDMRGKDFWTLNGNELQMNGEYKPNKSKFGSYQKIFDIR
jgi:hypothetical protein